MLINIELPNGSTIKVNSDWYYSLSDYELKLFYENNTLNYSYQQTIRDPFDNSVTDFHPPELDEEYPLDYDPEDF